MTVVLDLLTPWITLLVVLFLLVRSQQWVLLHLFGMTWAASGNRRTATIIYIVLLLPGIALREISRYLMGGMLHLSPVYINIAPQAMEDGYVETRIMHYATINPIYIALLAVTPVICGLVLSTYILDRVLNVPLLIAAAGTSSEVFRQALELVMRTPNLVFWLYILFGVANTMLPSRNEVLSTWFFAVIILGFLGLMAFAGLWQSIYEIMAGPVSRTVYSFTTFFTITFGLNLIGGSLIWLIERVVGAFTNRRVQYQAPKVVPKTKAALPAPKGINEIRLPIPGPPGKAFPAGVSVKAQPVKVEPVPKEALPAGPDLPSLPARAQGTDVPAVIGKDPSKETGAPAPKQPAAIPVTPGKAAEVEEKPAIPTPLKPPVPGFGVKPADKPAEKTGEFKPVEPAKPGAPTSPFGKPAERSAEKTGEFKRPPEPVKPGAPTSPFGKPAERSAEKTGEFKRPPEPVKPGAPTSPFGKPAERPIERTAEVKQTETPPSKALTPFGKPAEPAKPPVPSGTTPPAPNTPPKPPTPTSVPPLSIGKAPDRTARPAPKPLGKNTAEARSPARSDEDVIDADVIDSDDVDDVVDAEFIDDEDQTPPSTPAKTSPFGGSAPKSGVFGTPKADADKGKPKADAKETRYEDTEEDDPYKDI
jgi:hypothetical protein